MRDLYLIDGYNVIFWLPHEFDRNDLESSRKKLIDLMQDYGAHNHVEVIVVFDGQSRSMKEEVETVSPFFHVVYTPSRMTADSYIERESYRRKDEYRDFCCHLRRGGTKPDSRARSVQNGRGGFGPFVE